jgi:hypothetical protein
MLAPELAAGITRVKGACGLTSTESAGLSVPRRNDTDSRRLRIAGRLGVCARLKGKRYAALTINASLLLRA